MTSIGVSTRFVIGTIFSTLINTRLFTDFAPVVFSYVCPEAIALRGRCTQSDGRVRVHTGRCRSSASE